MEKKIFYKFENKSADSNEFIMKEKMLCGAGRNCFSCPEEAKVHFEEANRIALIKYENIIDGINKLKEVFGDFSYDYFVLGDTYGIESDGMYLSFNVNGYEFQFNQ